MLLESTDFKFKKHIFMKLPNEYILERNKLFQTLPIKDWHIIIEFEKIVKNYIQLNKAL